MATHHPDRGGDAEAAARINETYRRMTIWLERRRAREAPQDGASRPAGLRDRAAKIATAAFLALTALAAMRGSRRR